jgi:hypothetical protein
MPPLPPYLQALLKPDETVLWTGKGAGLELSLSALWGPALMLSIGLFAWVRAAFGPLAGDQPRILGVAFLTVWLAFGGFFTWRIVTGPRHQVCVLTSRRVILFEPRFPPQVLMARAPHAGWYTLNGGVVRGTAERGTIWLRSRLLFLVQYIPFPNIERPAEVAALITATLKPKYPIRDGTRRRRS